jgi:hypothetical protein
MASARLSAFLATFRVSFIDPHALWLAAGRHMSIHVSAALDMMPLYENIVRGST